ncbi:hypothetical protein BK129_20795 [Paenibacillus amylolyticus]|uniref:hypothetical protein n=1 Tax=Paenibacillus amylolyticus TaxID=1451 RepID=UPI0009701E9B|nr:hypothetical protein [Paenibacillus amylolyticus]OMF03727.1 hypothetical protein BK129_20795 [Paenibacillus amylolyticus]
MKYANVLLSSVIVLGSLGTLSTASSSLHTSDKIAHIAANSTSVNSSTYQSISKFEKTKGSNKIVWRGDDITITANTLKLDVAADFEQNIIDTIVVTHGKEKHTLQTGDFEVKLLDISSVAESPSNEWVAIQVEKSAGSNLILVNLKTGNYTIINERLEKAGKQNVETISSYNWSPKEDIIAFSYGSTDKSTLAIYDTKKDSVVYLPRATNYISTGLILWYKNGKNIDYISEYPSDQWILFRYDTGSKKVKPVKRITKKEFQQWFKLDKYPTK